MTFASYLVKLRSEGKRSFTLGQVMQGLGLSQKAAQARCARAKNRGEISSPVKGLYVIVPPENRDLGSLPVEQLIPVVMKFLKIDYYVCLLSAGLYYGASHQKPQVFQVMLSKRHRGIYAGVQRIQLIYKKSIEGLPIQQFDAKTGYLNVSSPELTAADLLLYPNQSGGLSNVATVLAELQEVMDPQKLIPLTRMIKQKSWVQRLGYILEKVDALDIEKRDGLIAALQSVCENRKLSYVPLTHELSIRGCKRNKKWCIIENTTIEIDI